MGVEATATQYGSGNNKNAWMLADPGGLSSSNPYSSKTQQPQQPDYIGAANAQSSGSIATALANNMMAQPNVNTPLGSQTWQQIGTNTITVPGLGNISIPKMQQNIQLSPEQQALYMGSTAIKGGLLGQAGENLSQPIGNSAQDIADKAYGAMTSRLDPQWAQREQMQKTQLANQGLAPGGEAYDAAMREFNNARTDAYQQANLGAIQTMPQTYQIAQGLRDLPLNELAALSNAQPVQMPTFQPTQYPGQAQGPNTLTATGQQGAWQQAMYNAGVQQANAQRQGLMGLGSAAMAAFL